MKRGEIGDWRLTVFWVATACATAIAGFVFGWCWRDRPGSLATVSLLNVMTAIGTVGSAVGAVGIAGWQYLSKKNDRYLEAVHAIGSAYPRLIALRAALLSAEKHFESEEVMTVPSRELRRSIRKLRKEYRESDLPNSAQLIPLGLSYSRALAAVESHLNTVLRLSAGDLLETESDRRETVQFMLATMRVAIPRLKMLGDLGYELMTGISASDEARVNPSHAGPSAAQ